MHAHMHTLSQISQVSRVDWAPQIVSYAVITGAVQSVEMKDAHV